MAFDLIPRKLFSFANWPTLSSLWDDEDWVGMTSTQSGLSIYEDDKNVYVEAAVPGVDPADIEATYQDGYVWIHAKAKEEEKDKNRKFYCQATRSYSYRVAVPGDVDPQIEPKASYKHGIMKVIFAKSEASKPKKITVKQLAEENSQKEA